MSDQVRVDHEERGAVIVRFGEAGVDERHFIHMLAHVRKEFRNPGTAFAVARELKRRLGNTVRLIMNDRADIAAGIHVATARRVRNLFNRIGLEADLVFTGGVSNNAGMKKALEDILGHPISTVKLDTIYAGALGAAVIAQKSLPAAAGTAETERLDAVAA